MPNEIDNLPAPGGTDSATTQPQNDRAADWDYYDPDEDQETEKAQDEAPEGERDPDEQVTDEVAASDDDQSADSESNGEADDKGKAPLIELPTGEKLPIEEVAKGYMRQQDYTRKTQAVAETRRAIEATAEQLQAVQTAFVDYLSQYVPPAPKPELAQINPAEYVAQQAAHEAAIKRIREIAEIGRQAQGARQQIDKVAHQETLEREFSLLTQRIPALRDPKARDKFRDESFAAAREFGFTDEELSTATDHRLFLLADAAREGLAARKARAAAREKVAAKPPVSAPNKRSAPQARQDNQKAMDRLKRTGSIRDAMAIDFE